MRPLWVVVLLAMLPAMRLATASTVAEVALRDGGDLTLLQREGFDITYISAGQVAEVILKDDAERERLDHTGLGYRIAMENLEGWLRSRLEPGRDDMGGYMTFDELVERLNQLHEDYSDIVGEPVSLGRSIEDRDIWAVKISDEPDENEDEPEVLFVSLIHCREVITAEVLFGMMEYLAENYGDDDQVTEWVDNREIWVIPCQNPDGYVYNEENDPEGGGMWRKNRRNNGDGTYGVDLNRNFGYEWGYDDIGSSPDPSSTTYRGEEAFSEPETQVVRDFVNDHSIAISIYFHSWGNLCLYPFSYDYIHAPDRSPITALALRMIAGNDYQPGTGWETIYLTNGDSDDWLYGSDEHDPIMAFTIEVGDRDDYFWPPLNRVEPLVEENIPACLTAIEYGDNPLRVLDPPAPAPVLAYSDDEGALVISWVEPEDRANPPAGYNVRALTPGEPFVDDSPEDQQMWDLANFSHSQADRHSGDYSYRVQTLSDMATLTLREAVIAPDTVRAWVNYNLITGIKHYLAFEYSRDGYSWEPLPGADTRDLVINNRNLGPGLTGDSHGWTETWWTTGAAAGEVLKFRFRYYQFNRRQQGEAAFIDDIGPFYGFDEIQMLVEDTGDTVWSDAEFAWDDDMLFQVQTVDEDGDLSFWSQPATIGAPPAGHLLAAERGWTVISLPVVPFDAAPRDMFAPWIESGSLFLLKDAAGQVMYPEHELYLVGDWNPLAGYLLNMNRADTVQVVGQRTAVDTPIRLEEGWNLTAYLPEADLEVDEALESIWDNLTLVKNGYGAFAVPDYDFDNLVVMRPGAGFWINLAAADTLIYPAAEGGRLTYPAAAVRSGFTPPSPFSHSLLLTFSQPPGEGRLVLRDSGGNVAGATPTDSRETVYGLAAWGEMEPETVGYAAAEPLHIFWEETDGRDFEVLTDCGAEQLKWRMNGFTAAGATVGGAVPIPLGHALLACSPNPFNGTAHLTFNLARKSRILLQVYDIRGRSVATLSDATLSAGVHRVVWNASGFPSGVYIARMAALDTGNGASSLKLLLMR